MLMIEERRAVLRRLTLDMVAWNEDRHPRNRRGKFQKKEAVTTPDVAVNAMRQAILTHNDVLHAVYRADIGYVDFIWGSEGGRHRLRASARAQWASPTFWMPGCARMD